MPAQERAVAYYRMSRDQQEASIPRQRESVEAYAAKHGYQIVREYVDEGISGDATEQRAGFLRMRQDAARGDFTHVLCWDQDRFGRFDSLEAGYWIKPLRDANVQLVTVKDGPINWNDFIGRMMYQLKQEGKHQFLRDLSHNTSAGQVRNAKLAYFNGGTVPYGFDRLLLDDKDEPVRRLRRGEKTDKPPGWHTILIPVDDPEEIENVRWMFRTFAERDISCRTLANELNARGVPGPGSAEKGRKTPWCRQALLIILQNPNYVGDSAYGRVSQGKYCRVIDGEPVAVPAVAKTKGGNPKKQVNAEGVILNRDCHDGIIDRDLFERVQAKLRGRRRERRAPHGTSYPLAGLLRCGHCGKLMHGCTNRYKRRKTTSCRRYVCSSNNLNGRSACPFHSVREALLLPYLVRRIERDYLAPGKVERLRDRLLKKLEAKRRQAEGAKRVEGLRKRLEALDGEVRDATMNVLRAKANADLLNEALTELRAERERVAAELRDAEGARQEAVNVAAVVEEAVGKLRALAERLKDADPARVRAVLLEMIAGIDLYFGEVPKRKKTYRPLVRGVARLRPQVGDGASGSDKGVTGTPHRRA